MPSNTMLEVMARKKQQLEAQEALENKVNEQPQDDEPEDEPTPDETADDLDPDEDDGNDGDDDTPNDKERSAEEDQPNYQNKFERLRKKQSKIEKQNAEYERQMQLLQLELEQAKQKAKAEPKQPDTPKAKPQAVTDDEVDSYLSEELGDDYAFMDEASKRTFKLLAKETLALRSQTKANDNDVDIEKIVSKRLAEEQQKKQAKSYSNDMDKFVKSLDPDADFIALINEPSFDDFLDDNRVAKAMFVEASSTFDEESKQIMKDVISSYLGKSALKPLGKKNTSPTVATKSTPEPKTKRRKVSTKAYEEAKVTFKRRPSQRREALKVIQAYEAQEAEG